MGREFHNLMVKTSTAYRCPHTGYPATRRPWNSSTSSTRAKNVQPVSKGCQNVDTSIMTYRRPREDVNFQYAIDRLDVVDDVEDIGRRRIDIEVVE